MRAGRDIRLWLLVGLTTERHETLENYEFGLGRMACRKIR